MLKYAFFIVAISSLFSQEQPILRIYGERDLAKIEKILYSNQQATRVSLVGNDLKTFPKNLSYLTDLTELNLALNEFENLPDSGLLSLNNLEQINLSLNRNLNYESTFAILSRVQKLKTLEIYKNYQPIPPGLSNLSNLEALDISKNDLISLPNDISKLAKLKSLDLSDNPIGENIVEILSQLSELKDLERLVFENCNLDSLSKGIGELKGLTLLNLRQNRLTALPSNLKELSQLETLILSGNPLEYEDLLTLQHLPALKYLTLPDHKDKNMRSRLRKVLPNCWMNY